MPTIVGAFEAKTHLSSLLDRVERGEEVVITWHGRPVARMLTAQTLPEFGSKEDLLESMRRFGSGRRLGMDWRILRAEGRKG